jgi:hypothetical protein
MCTTDAFDFSKPLTEYRSSKPMSFRMRSDRLKMIASNDARAFGVASTNIVIILFNASFMSMEHCENAYYARALKSGEKFTALSGKKC